VWLTTSSPWPTSLGWFVGYDFDPDDWQAIETGLRETDGDAGRWYNFEFAGRLVARLWLAKDHGTAVVQIKIDVDDQVQPRVEASIAILQHFRFRDPA